MVIFIEWELLRLNSISIIISILLDWISLLFIRFVLFISSIVIYYRDEYIHGDENLNRFIILVLIFVLSIIFLIISPNLISILLGWDGLGLVSYCLVIYYQNIKSYNAGILTALSNRIGDVALLIAIAWILNYGSWNYIFYLESMKNDFEIQFISYIVVLAAITKRAQIPFSSWLPAAIAAPTPVSALVHSSTLVTAGVYLLIRFNNLFINTYLSKLLLFISVLTIFIAGLGANYEFDLKKIIALSTLRQLGLIIRILSIGYPKIAFFHLLTHALFKALLFICAGSVIHNIKNNQDIRLIGGLFTCMPLTISCINVANLALCGIPFLAGFYSKDLILELATLSIFNILIFILYFLSTGLTVCYTFRLIYFTIRGDFNFNSLNSVRDEYWIILKGILGLLFLAIIGGSILRWLILNTPLIICLPIELKILALLVSILGAYLGYELYQYKIRWNLIMLNNYYILNFVGNIWYIPTISTIGVNYYSLKFGYKIVKTIDQGWNEYFGGQSLYNWIINSTKLIYIIYKNDLKIHLIIFVLWILIIILFILYLNSLYLEHNIEAVKEINYL